MTILRDFIHFAQRTSVINRNIS